MALRNLPLQIALCAMLACGGQPVLTFDIFGDAVSDDGSDVENEILTADVWQDLQPDTAVPPDLPSLDSSNDDTSGDCSSTLKNWMCASDDCPGDGYCSGFVSGCDEPPCWGAFCDYIPGNCMPGIRSGLDSGVCLKRDDCPSGWSCVTNIFTGMGLCREHPGPGLCWSNRDCGENQTCAGEVTCHIGNQCNGPEHRGICMDNPPDGHCYDDAGCVGGWCDGAVLCAQGDNSCVPAAGTCVAGTAPGCESVDGGTKPCEGSEWGNWCVGRLTRGLGWCAPPPASPEANGQCWEDADCTSIGILCRSAMTCPPRSYCRSAGFHSGICGPAPAVGDGIILRFADQGQTGVVHLNESSKVVLQNRGPVAIYLAACDTVAVNSQKNGVWDDIVLWTYSTGECASLGGQTRILIRIPPGSSVVMPMAVDSGFDSTLAGRLIRLNLRYYLGCIPGGTMDDDMDCLEESNNLWRNMYGDPIQWNKTGT